MTAVNSHNEICDVLDVSQFVSGKSAFECVAYSAALLKFAGKPGQGPTGTALQASNLAQYWYGREEGGNSAANKNGMSLDAEYAMLGGMGLAWTPTVLNVEGIRQSLREGRPCIVCGHEDGFFDLALGDRVPYNWTPTGNHAIVVTGMDAHGNLLVHDCANVDANGKVRPGPRIYDASKMQLVSVTSVSILQGGDMLQPLSIDMPNVANMFRQLDENHWQSIATGRILQFGLLADYKANGQASLTYLGDVLSPEQVQPNGDVVQFYAHGARLWQKATGKVLPFDLFSQAGQEMLRKALAVPAPAPEAPQEHAVIEQMKTLLATIP